MRQASKRIPDSAEKTVRDIRRATRRHHSAEEKIRIVLEGLRGEDSIAELCRKEGSIRTSTIVGRRSSSRSFTVSSGRLELPTKRLSAASSEH
jgi:transposase-like protein